jgi:hypothetical protein
MPLKHLQTCHTTLCSVAGADGLGNGHVQKQHHQGKMSVLLEKFLSKESSLMKMGEEQSDSIFLKVWRELNPGKNPF